MGPVAGHFAVGNFRGFRRALALQNRSVETAGRGVAISPDSIEVEDSEAVGGKYLDRIFIADAATEKSSPVHVCCNDERVTLSWLITERQHQVAPKPLPTL